MMQIQTFLVKKCHLFIKNYLDSKSKIEDSAKFLTLFMYFKEK
jgi:hypothetical protein